VLNVKLPRTYPIIFGLLFLVVLVGCGQSKTEEMLGYLESDNASRRAAACQRLGMLGAQASEAYDKILDHYRNDPSPSVRANCLEALGQIGGRGDTVKTLTDALNDSSDEMKLHALRGFGDLGSPQAIPAVSDLLDHGNPEVRESAASALQEIGDPEALPTLRNHLESETNHDAKDAIENAIFIIESENS
jgi:HEAT repeat protein